MNSPTPDPMNGHMDGPVDQLPNEHGSTAVGKAGSAAGGETGAETGGETGWERWWQELVSAAVLGVERRDPPDIDVGVVRDFVDDAVMPDPAARLVSAVAATVAARRAGFVALPPAARLDRPPPDPRPLLPEHAARVGASSIARWPILEDEWMIEIIKAGWRLPPDVLISALARSRNDRARRERLLIAGGGIAEWLAEHFPALALAGGRRSSLVEDLLAMPDDLSPDVAELAGLDAFSFADRIVAETLQSTGSGTARQKILTTLVARARPAVLVDAADALSRVGTSLSVQLHELARTRFRLLESLAEIGVAPIEPT